MVCRCNQNKCLKHHLIQAWSSEACLPPPQAQTFSRLLPMSSGTSWACSTPESQEPSCPHTTPSPIRWGWARTTSKASSTCMELTRKSCPRHRPRLHLRQTQRPMRLSLLWVELIVWDDKILKEEFEGILPLVILKMKKGCGIKNQYQAIDH